MRTAGMTVALAVCWLVGVVGAASFPPDDQYSPQQSPYKRDALRGPRGYPNWLEYHQAPSSELQSPENKPGMTSMRLSDFSGERNAPKDSMIRNLDFQSLAPGAWNKATARAMKNSTKPHSDLNVPEEGLEILPASREDPFDTEDNFQDQGPGSVEVYKLDLHRENSLLVPLTDNNQPPVTFRIKSKHPKKAKGNDILWKLKPIDPSKTLLPAIFREPPSVYRDETISPESMREIEEVQKEEVFTVGGVPELQVGCEGLEALDRKRRSSGPGEEDTDEEYKPKFEDPVYRESTEPILLRVTPIVLDFEDEPPSGQIYEELDELLKLKSSTTPEPTTKRTNRGDIDPALENYEHEAIPIDEMLPERGDLGSSGNKGNARVQRSIGPQDSKGSQVEGVTFLREANGEESPLTSGVDGKNDDTLSSIIGSRSKSSHHRGGRKLLSIQYPERDESQARMRHHDGDDENQEPDLWGFGEDDGEKLVDAEESDADKLRRVEEDKRRREYERRREEEMSRRRGERERHPHSHDHQSKAEKLPSEMEKIRKEYGRLQEKEQRERQRLEEEKRRQGGRRQWEDAQRRAEEAKRRQSEESQRRMEEEERKHRDQPHSRRREEEERRRDWIRRQEEEQRRIRLENERNHQAPPAALTRPSPYDRSDNLSRNHQEEERREAEDRKLREYIERNRPINPKNNNDRRYPDDQTRRRNEDEERRKNTEAQRRRLVDEERRRQQEEQEKRHQMEEQQRRHQPPNETEWRRQHEEEQRRRQMEEQQRRHQPPNETEWRRQHEEEQRRRQMEEQQKRYESPDEIERRRQMEEQRRRDRPDHDRERDEERRRELEEEKKLQEYVRRNQPVNLPRKNSSQESDWQEQRRILDEARQWEQHKAQKDGRSRGPSAPTSIGQRRSQENLEELRRRQEAQRLEDQRRRFEEEGRKREEEYRRQESRRHEEERQRLVAQRQREEANRRRPNWQDSRRPENTTRRGDDRNPGELRRPGTSQGIPSNSRRNQEDQWRRTQELERQRQQQYAERERLRMEQERNDRNNGRRRPQHGETRPSEQRQRSESARNQEETERRRQEEARLNALPVSARIMIHTNQAASRGDRTLPTAPPVPPVISIGTRAGFGNEIDFPAINPNRPGLAAHRFPAPATQKPPTKSPSPCVWAVVNCCPANNRLSTCFESMGCPGINWDPNPCRASIQSAARAQVLSFYDTAEDNYSRV